MSVGAVVAKLAIGASASATIVALLAAVSLVSEINRFYEESMTEMVEFRHISNDAWRGLMAFREQPSGGDASETFGSLVSRIRRQNGAANMKPRAHGVHSVRRHAPRISGVSSHRVGGGGSYQQEVPASSAGGGGSQCNCGRKSNNCPAGPPGPPGENGQPGEDGLDGQPGRSGDAAKSTEQTYGDRGCIKCPAGPPGPPGEDGVMGESGPPGSPGDSGFDGQMGQPGPMGPPGDRGVDGIPGPPGDIGPKGQDGSRGSSQPGPKGPPGSIGAPGQPGNDGTPGASIPGPPGQPGGVGKLGMPGPKGSPGAAGNSGSIGPDAAYCPCPNRTNARESNPAPASTSKPSYKRRKV